MQIGESVCVAISGQEAGVEAAAEEAAMNDGYCSLSCETFFVVVVLVQFLFSMIAGKKVNRSFVHFFSSSMAVGRCRRQMKANIDRVTVKEQHQKVSDEFYTEVVESSN